MRKEEAELELREAQGDAAEPQSQDAAAPAPAAAEADATEADVSEADLDQEDQEAQEKVPMTAGEEREAGVEPEKNGAVKLKIPEDEAAEEVPFTGLNKEELLRVAGTTGWVRTRWTLLLLFWLGWLGMLAGAVLIILQAPRCKDLPALNWWNEGPLYRVRSIQGFTETGDIKGVEQKLDSLSELKVKGLVLGPIHVAPKDDPMALSFEEVSPDAGSLEQFKSLLKTAHRRGMSVVLDLTPNYRGSSGPWFSDVSVSSVAERLKSALVFWLTVGVDGVQLDSVETVLALVPSQWSDIRTIVQNWTDSQPHKRLLLGVTQRSVPSEVSELLSDSGLDLLLSPVLSSQTDSSRRAQSVQLLYSSHSQMNLLWSLSPGPDSGPGPNLDLLKMDLLLLLTLPGTALIHSGDESGLRTNQFVLHLNDTQQEERKSCRTFLSSLSSLRSRERSLLFGDFSLVIKSSSVLVYLRVWDQSTPYLVLFNHSPDQDFIWTQDQGLSLGAQVRVVLSSNSTALSPDSDLDLREVRLGPQQAALLQLSHSL